MIKDNKESTTITESTEESSGLTLGKVAKTAGKVALTMACPPIGLQTVATDFEDRVASAIFGTVSSAIIGGWLTFGGSGEGLSKREVYDSPSIETKYSVNFHGLTDTILGIGLSPAYVLSRLEKRTILNDQHDSPHVVSGGDVIKFDKGKRVYSLNFGPEREFRDSNGNFVSVNEAEQRLAQRILELTAQGNLLSAKAASEGAGRIRSEYNSKRGLYQAAVDKMNEDFNALVEDATEEMSALTSASTELTK